MSTLPLHFRAEPTPAQTPARAPAGSVARNPAQASASAVKASWPDTQPMCFRSEAFAEDLQELCNRTGTAQPVVMPDRGHRSLLRLAAVTMLTGLALAGTLLGLAGATARLFGS
jgi:hypothetical protein